MKQTYGSAQGTLHLDIPDPPRPLADGEQFEICVIGAGPAGLLTACLLAKQGKRVTVIEMRARPTDFYGSFPVVLNRRGLTALERLGVSDVAKFHESGRDVKQIHIVPKNKTVAVVDTLGMCIMRDQVMGILLGIADDLGVPVYWEHKLVDIELGSKTLTIQRDHGEVTARVATLVGADGNYSKVRRVCEEKQAVSVEAWEWGVQLRYALAPEPPNTVLPPEVDGDNHYVLGADGYVCQQPNGVWSVSFSTFEDSEDFLKSNDPSPENIAKLRELCMRVATPFAENLLVSDEVYKTFYDCKIFNGQIIKCSTLAPKDWIALIGDAAHAVAPFTGEGINSALESAMLLSDTLVEGGSCKDFDSVRRQDAHAACAIALRNREIVIGSPSHKAANTITTIGLSIAKSMGCIKGVMSDYMLGRLAADGVWRYSDLVALDNRQQCCLYPFGMCCFFACCCCCGKCN